MSKLRQCLFMLTVLAVSTTCKEPHLTEPEGADRPHATGPTIAVAVRCLASVSALEVSCERVSGPRGPVDPQFLIVGGQGVYVLLDSKKVSYDAGNQVFQADVTVQNLMSRTLGTQDGKTTTGVRVFFHTGPTVTGGTGTVTVRNADGAGSFTGSNQPYHEYMEILETGERSTGKTWEWNVPSTVSTFLFEVYIDADTPDPIALDWDLEGPLFEQCFGPYTWICDDEMTFRVTDGSGEVWVSAAGVPGPDYYPVTPSQITSSIVVSPRERYQASLSVSFVGTGSPNWPRQSAEWPCARIAITSPAEPSDTVFKDLRPQFDILNDPPDYFCSPEYELVFLGLTSLGASDTARAGDWEATAGFGDFVFTVNPQGDEITWIQHTFDNFSCGGAFRTGSEDFSGSWPITAHQFAIQNTNPDGDTYLVQGEFSATEEHAHGSWEFGISGSMCSGAWLGQWNLPPSAMIDAPVEGASYPFGDIVSFSGSGTDPEDGPLTGGALVWKSNLDGTIGTGESFTHDDLSVGDHRIILTARDSEGWTGRDTVNITIRASQNFATGMWHAPTEFGQVSFVVNPQRTGITEITYNFDHWYCGTGSNFWYGYITKTMAYPGWLITDGEFSVTNTIVDPDLVMTIEGAFETEDHASGTSTGISFGTVCSGPWEGDPATKLFLREGGTPFLSALQDPSVTDTLKGQSGASWEFAATLDQPIVEDTYSFWLWLRADAGGTSRGDFDVSLSYDHDGSVTELGTTTFGVLADDSIIPFLHAVTGISGGVPGDLVRLRITYVGQGWGEIAYGSLYDSHIVIPGHVTVSLPSGPGVLNSEHVARNIATGNGVGRRLGVRLKQ